MHQLPLGSLAVGLPDDKVQLLEAAVAHDAGYTATLPSAWLTRNGNELRGVMVHSGWWDDYNFAAQPFVLSILSQT